MGKRQLAIVDRFLPARVRDDFDARRRGRILVVTCFSFALATPAVLGLRLAFAELHPLVTAVALLSTGGFAATPWLLRASGSLRTAGVLVTQILVVLIIGAVAFSGGLESKALPVAPLLPVVAAYLIDRRAGAWVALALLAAIALFAVLPAVGVSFPPALDGAGGMAVQTAILSLVTVLAALFAGFSEQQRVAARTDLEAAMAKLRTKNDELERFTYAVSHDLKGPLATVRGFLSLLKRDALEARTDRVEHYCGRIDRATAQMARMIGDLLELPLIERRQPAWADVGVGEVAREAAELLAGRITATRAEIEIAPGMPRAHADRTLLLTVFQNLIDNAVKYHGGDGVPRVRVEARRDGADVICSVRDNGKGIPPQVHDKIFELFHRADERQEGSGVGLASVQRAVEAHGGRIWVESDGKGNGSTFYFTLPGRRPPRASAIRAA